MYILPVYGTSTDESPLPVSVNNMGKKTKQNKTKKKYIYIYNMGRLTLTPKKLLD